MAALECAESLTTVGLGCDIAACHTKNNSSQSQNGVFIPLQPLIEWCFEWVWALPVGNVKQLWLQHPRSTELFVVSFCTTKWPEGVSYLGIIRLHFCLFLPRGQSQSFDLTNPDTAFLTPERGGAMEPENRKKLHSYQTDEQQCSMLMVTRHHLAGRAEQIRVLCGPMRSYPKFFSELWIFLTPTNFFVIGPLVSGQRPRRRCIFKH